MYDFAVIGSGLFGSVFAREAKLRNKKVIVIEKRPHIGGNVFTSNIDGIVVHEYGAHIWHTPSKKIHDYMCQFCAFNNYRHTVKVDFEGKLFSFPINLMTLHQLWNVKNPVEAEIILETKKIIIKDPKNFEEFALSQVGEEIYEKFIKGYTKKQWGKDPKELPASIFKRLPIRLTLNDHYFPNNHVYEGIPIGGYTPIIEKMLDGIEITLSEDFFENKKIIEKIADKIIYTGPLDKFFNFTEGNLEYRSLRFEKQFLSGDYQGGSVVNYSSEKVPHTRIIEHKHFEFLEKDTTIITKEFPQEFDGKNEPYYPINNDQNKLIANNYRNLSSNLSKYFFGGRLATYNYYDMHQVVASALTLSEKIL